MDSPVTDAARALAAGDPLGALKRVALRDDAPAISASQHEAGKVQGGFAVASPTMTGFGVGFAKAIPTYDVLPAASRSRIRQGEDGAGRRDAAQQVFAQRHQRRGDL